MKTVAHLHAGVCLAAVLLAASPSNGSLPEAAQMEVSLSVTGRTATASDARPVWLRLLRVRGSWDPVLLDPDGRVLSVEGAGDKLRVKVLYSPAVIPGEESGDWGRCSLDLERTGEGLYSGQWSGTRNGAEQSGVATATVAACSGDAGFVPPKVGEHPRFLFRRSELSGLRKKAQTPWGQDMVSRLRRIAQTENKSDPDVTTHRAVALGLLYQLTGDKALAEQARGLIEGDIASWYNIHFVHGAAVRTLQGAYAYDLIAEGCDPAFRARMRDVFLRKCGYLYSPPVGGFNARDGSNWAAMYRSALGMAAMAVLSEPAPKEVRNKEPSIVDVAVVPDFQVPEGVPVVPTGAARGVTNWLVAGPFEVSAGLDPLSSVGGAGTVRPRAGMAVKYIRTDGSNAVCAFAMMDPTHRVTEKRAADMRRTDLAGIPELSTMAGRRYLTTLCLHAVMDVGKAGHYRFDFPRTHMEDVKLYLSGQAVAPGAVVRVQAGKHPLVMVAAIGVCGNWETMELPFRMNAVAEQAATDWLARKRRRYAYEEAVRAADREKAAGGAIPDREAVQWLREAEERIANWPERALGERGWNGEGEAYTQHAMRLVLPFGHAFRNVLGRSFATVPNLSMAFLLYVNKTIFRETGVAMPSYGPGGGPLGVDNWARGFGFVPEKCRGAALWAWNRTQAMSEAGTLREPNGVVSELDGLSAAFRFVNYPLESKEQDPDGVLDRAVMDRRKGGFVMRNRWQDGDDCVATVFLDSETGKAGWRGPDWGDIRLSGLGADWAVRGIPWGNGVSTRKPLPDGSMPDARQHGSVMVVPGTLLYGGRSSGPAAAVFGAPYGKVTGWVFAEDGSGIVQADLSNGYVNTNGSRVPMTRIVAVDYSGASGAPCLVAVADRMSGTLGTNVWQFCTELSHKVSVTNNTFTLAAKNGAALQGTVVAPESPKIAFEPVDFRHEVNYHGRHSQATFRQTLIRVTGGEAFLVVMTIQKGVPPAVKSECGRRETVVSVGGQTVSWDDKGLRLAKFVKSGGL